MRISVDPMKMDRQKAWAVFTGRTELKRLKILRPGFRHCFVLLQDGGRWISIDPLATRMEICMHHDLPTDFDLPGWLEEQGHTVVPASLDRDITNPAPCAFFTCVEAVKRVLGIHAWRIVTPWQLYRYLIQHN